jgi:methylglutaconyl-CoA hydratase
LIVYARSFGANNTVIQPKKKENRSIVLSMLLLRGSVASLKAYNLVSIKKATNTTRCLSIASNKLFQQQKTSSIYDPNAECRLEFLKEDNNQIAVISLNRERFKNALGRNLLAQLKQSLYDVRFSEQAKDVRVVIVRSIVDGIFCAGADLKERSEMSQKETEAFVYDLRSTFSQLEDLPVPTIACLSGAALGGGLELALACDIRVAEKNAKCILGLSETSLAIIPGAGGTQRLPRVVGMPKAKQLIFTAQRLNAQQALEIGLVNECVEEGKGFDKSLEIARQITPNGPIAVKVAKVAIQEGMQMDRRTGMMLEQQCYAQVIPTKDRLEGLKAFKEKRKPEYKGE